VCAVDVVAGLIMVVTPEFFLANEFKGFTGQPS